MKYILCTFHIQVLEPKELVMEVQLTVLDSLGIKMYTSLPPVISELVANAWDADASEISVNIPETYIDTNYSITITDNGSGMTFDELNNLYLKIGRNRREEMLTDKTQILGRRVIGRKGIGKLSVFGVAELVRFESIKDNKKIIFEMDLNDIKKTKNGNYKPKIIENGPTTEKSGIKITLSKFKRKKGINIDEIRRGLAKRFSILDSNFKVFVNDHEISPYDRELRNKAEYEWNIDEEIKPNSGWFVKGWIGMLDSTIRGDDRAGIVIMARGKLVEEPTKFDVNGGKEAAYFYLVGELTADFLDEAEDLIATHRSSIIWESEEGQALKEWGQKKLIKLSQAWSTSRVERREKDVRSDPGISRWLNTLSIHERNLANRVIRAITVNETLEKERQIELVNHFSTYFQYGAFKELAAHISETPTAKDVLLVELFQEWGVLEAKELQRIFEGRITTIEKFEEYIKSDAREVPTIHNFFKEFPWILDIRWTNFQDEVKYSDILKENYKDWDKAEDGRIDFLSIGFGDTLNIIELKRPGHKIDMKDLRQIEDYVHFMRTQIGNNPAASYSDVSGYLICERVKQDLMVSEKIKSNKQIRIYLVKYRELLATAQRHHSTYINKLNKTIGSNQLR